MTPTQKGIVRKLLAGHQLIRDDGRKWWWSKRLNAPDYSQPSVNDKTIQTMKAAGWLSNGLPIGQTSGRSVILPTAKAIEYLKERNQL